MKQGNETNNMHRGKKILVPFFYYYYLFDYLRFLVPRLIDDGFAVTVLTYRQEVIDLFSHDKRVTIAKVPLLIRYLVARSGRIPHRFALWIIGWWWALFLRMEYDFAILPFDNKPIWYILSCLFPAITCHNTTELIDTGLTKKRDKYRERTYPGLHPVMLFLDRILGGRLLPHWPGQINRYWPREMIIDRLMGYWTQNFYCGFSNIRYLTVSGYRIKENYISMGIREKKVIVTGNPNYDHLKSLKDTFDVKRQAEFKSTLGILRDRMVFSFFLSPSSFTELQIKEVMTVIKEIHARIPGAFFILKFHPKTEKRFPFSFGKELEGFTKDFLVITEYKGEEHNARLIMISDYIVQKQCTVGFIAMLLRKKCISYNLFDTHYDDDMYKYLNASVHVETIQQLRLLLDDIEQGQAFSGLERKQQEACNNYCLENFEANKNIANVIKNHFKA